MLKVAYNHPQILSRINTGRLKSAAVFRKPALNINSPLDFWSFEYLSTHMQKHLLSQLVNYWWPKYCIKLHAFHDYVRENYPSYHAQVRLINSYNSMLNTTSTTMLSTSNKRIGTFNTLVDSEYVANWMSGRSKRGVEHRNESDDDSEIADDTDDENKKKNNKTATKKRANQKMNKKTSKNKSSNHLAATSFTRHVSGLEGFQTRDLRFKTSPPVGWKRPPSLTTLIAKRMIENEQEGRQLLPVDMSREVFMEIVYRDRHAAHIFMKYLASRNKIVIFLSLLSYFFLYYIYHLMAIH